MMSYLPPLQSLLGTAALSPDALLFVLPFPFIVWGAARAAALSPAAPGGTSPQLEAPLSTAPGDLLLALSDPGFFPNRPDVVQRTRR